MGRTCSNGKLSETHGKASYGSHWPHGIFTLGVTKPLRNLITEGVPFVWDKEREEAFLKCKYLLVSNDLLVLYNPDLPVVVYCDASPVGVGAVLCHTVNVNSKPVNKPVIYASSSLTETQQRYAQIDREGHSIIFAVTKFHKFSCGRPFLLVTDNFAIHRIFHANKGLPVRTGHRLQHWPAILQAYNYTLVHQKVSFFEQRARCLVYLLLSLFMMFFTSKFLPLCQSLLKLSQLKRLKILY